MDGQVPRNEGSGGGPASVCYGRLGSCGKPGNLQRKRMLYSAAVALAPSGAAGVFGYVQTNSLGVGLVMSACVLGTTVAINRPRCPDHLMPLAGLAVRAAASMLGILLAGGIFLALGGAPPQTLLASLIAAWLATALALLATARLQRAVTVRLGVVGSAKLAQSLAKEVRSAGLRGYEVVGWLDAAGDTDQVQADMPRLGSVDAIGKVAQAQALDLSSSASANRAWKRRVTAASHRLPCSSGFPLPCWERGSG